MFRGLKQPARILTHLGLALLLTAALTLGAPDNAAAAPATSRAVYLAHARAAIRALDRRWGAGPSPGNDWRGINAWQRFVIVDALADYTVLSGDRSELPRIKAAVINRHGVDGNDDDLWAAIAALRVRDLTNDDSLLAYAKQTFERITTQYWDNVCGGGLWWDHERTYKNAITNSLALHAAALLYLDTGEQAYLDWARREDRWIAASGMINADGLLNDGLNGRCANNGGPVFTYNQGAYLAGEALLSRIPGDPDDLARARRAASTVLVGRRADRAWRVARPRSSDLQGRVHPPSGSVGGPGARA
jgi:predicted alpha-1,6-mannanase (GH76 family)